MQHKDSEYLAEVEAELSEDQVPQLREALDRRPGQNP
jgi:hypothetical protein